MSSPTGPNQKPTGTSSAGQFSARPRSDANIDDLAIEPTAPNELTGFLSAPYAESPRSEVGDGLPDDWADDSAPDTATIHAANSEELWSYIRSGNRFVRVDAAMSPRITADQI